VLTYKIYAYDPSPDHLYAGDNPKDIGGWLVLIAIGLVMTPVYTLVTIFNNDYYNLANWNNITNPASAGYNMQLATLLVVEVFYNMFFLAYSILLLILFFNKRSSFPLLMSLKYGGSILFISLETYFLYKMNLLDNNNETIKELTQLIVSGAIWIPYLYVSERAKETFLNRAKTPEHMQEVYKLKV
jgi:hypothetical protein